MYLRVKYTTTNYRIFHEIANLVRRLDYHNPILVTLYLAMILRSHIFNKMRFLDRNAKSKIKKYQEYLSKT